MNTNLGDIIVSEEVINSMVSHIINETEGVYSKVSLTEKVLNRHIYVSSKIENDKVYIDSNIEVDFGVKIIPTIEKVQEKIKEKIKTMTSLEVSEINIKVVNIKYNSVD